MLVTADLRERPRHAEAFSRGIRPGCLALIFQLAVGARWEDDQVGAYPRHDKTGPTSPVDHQAVKGSKQSHRAARDSGELSQPMGYGFAALAALELLAGDRAPQFIDDSDRLAGDLLDRALQMLGPEPQPALACDGATARHDIHLGVVEETSAR